jgi:hypothetical protein
MISSPLEPAVIDELTRFLAVGSQTSHAEEPDLFGFDDPGEDGAEIGDDRPFDDVIPGTTSPWWRPVGALY